MQTHIHINIYTVCTQTVWPKYIPTQFDVSKAKITVTFVQQKRNGIQHSKIDECKLRIPWKLSSPCLIILVTFLLQSDCASISVISPGKGDLISPRIQLDDAWQPVSNRITAM